ncbi:MAG: hypothetical protein Q7S74_02945 [Nanoarchaeota archaeon]|nr:hypothetical protein [Nanoarchaeota archaeon]
MGEEEKSEKEKRIRAITSIYYSNPTVQKSMLEFGQHREVVPRYFEGFGRRPDTIQYASDIMGLVKRGATSFHASEELWNDPLNLNSEMTQQQMNDLRKSWDLLIDIDSKYLDVSKVLAMLVLEKLEEYGVRNYGLKFSGSKGFHIIISGKAFPKDYDGQISNESFPEWPRVICQFLTHITRREFNMRIEKIFGNLEEFKSKFQDNKIVHTESLCPQCGNPAKEGVLVVLKCPLCKTTIQRKDMKLTKKKLRCVQENCVGLFDVIEEKDYFECGNCEGISSINRKETSGRYKATFTNYAKKSEDYSDDLKESYSGISYGLSDLVLVAPRHLFRMPYSLHEKTALASIVIKKEELEKFSPRDADPLKVKIKDYMPNNIEGEAKRLLIDALEWKKTQKAIDDGKEKKRYSGLPGRNFDNIEIKGVTEDMFPIPIKKLLNGMEDGRKRGLFILITFLRSVNFSPEESALKIKEWNEKNKPPLKEGYVRSQLDWHFKQRKKILPPNYDNESFYKDLGLLDKKPDAKNPIVEVVRILRKRNN